MLRCYTPAVLFYFLTYLHILSSGLAISPKDVKALYRRCQAYQALGEVEKSYTDAVAVKRLEPGNKAVEDIFVSCVQNFVRVYDCMTVYEKKKI